MTTRSTPPDTEVRARPERRRYSATYKARILSEADAATDSGAVGALLRREGLYSSLLSKWRAQRERGGLAALSPQRTGPKPAPAVDPDLVRLRRENRQLRTRLERAEKIIEVQKKLSEILGIDLRSPTSGSDA